MSIPLNPAAGWRQVARLEVIGDAPALLQLIDDESPDYRIEPAHNSPHGFSWFDVRVDFSVGDRRAAHTAYAFLTALQRAADDGLLPGYRLINGQEWLLIGANLDRGDPLVEPPGQSLLA